MVSNTKIKVALVGASGYTGQELLRLLANHPSVEVQSVCSRSDAGMRLDERLPIFRGIYSLELSAIDTAILTQADLVFFATPNGVAMHYARTLLDAGIAVIDLSADFRLNDADQWKQWYGMDHASPELLAEAVYGLPELDNDNNLASARLVANPGCYATAMQLSLAPLMQRSDIVNLGSIVVDGKSGVSGAGKTATESNLLAQAGENVSAYKVSGHRHAPEVLQQLTKLADKDTPNITFVPHLIPMVRGILTTSYIHCYARDFDFYHLYNNFYRNATYVDVVEQPNILETKSVSGTNLCRLYSHVQGNSLVVVALIDNLIKGAAGQAIQNMNLMFSLNPTYGLNQVAQYP